MMCKRAAVVLAANHDWPTRFVFSAAEEIAEMLRNHYHVIPFFPPQATIDELYLRLSEHTQFAPVSGCERLALVLGFFCAHGADWGLLGEHDRVLLNATLCRLFDKAAILVMCACLRGGKLPAEILQQLSPEAAV